MKEIWKAVPGYEGQYEVSDHGRVRSLTRIVMCSGPVKGTYASVKKGRVLRPGPSNTGHLTVVLGKHQTRSVHDLVLRAFIGPPLPKHECRHLNSIPSDNRLVNLCWGTRSENGRDKILHEHGKIRKLTLENVIEIKRALLTPYRGLNEKLSKKFGVSFITISHIKHGRQHAWVSI